MYKVTNRLEQNVKYNDLIFMPKETKVIKDKPSSDFFIVEKIEEKKLNIKEVKKDDTRHME